MPEQALIFLPVLAQVLLTAIVWVLLYRSRLHHLRAERIHPQRLATAAEAAPLLAKVAGPSDNFSNQFELPVLFYLAALTAYVT